MTNPVQYYDSPESGRWINRFDVLWIKRDHRRVLNAQPFTFVTKMKYSHSDKTWKVAKVGFEIDFNILSN